MQRMRNDNRLQNINLLANPCSWFKAIKIIVE